MPPDPHPLEALIEAIYASLHAEGVGLVGTADLQTVAALLTAQSIETRGCPRAVSFAIPWPRDVVAKLREQYRTEGDFRRCDYGAYEEAYWTSVERIDSLSAVVVGALVAAGHTAEPVRARTPWSIRFPHKTAGHLAGLGWIGRNCMLVTPSYGPRVWLGTVLTDAMLPPTAHPSTDGIAVEPQCGECRVCVNRCPTGVFSGRTFRAADPPSERADFRPHWEADSPFRGTWDCGLCNILCPVGADSDQQTAEN